MHITFAPTALAHTGPVLHATPEDAARLLSLMGLGTKTLHGRMSGSDLLNHVHAALTAGLPTTNTSWLEAALTRLAELAHWARTRNFSVNWA